MFFFFLFFLYSPTSFHGRPSFALPFHMSSTFSINIYEDIISFKITRFHQKFLSTTLLQEWLNLDFLKREEGARSCIQFGILDKQTLKTGDTYTRRNFWGDDAKENRIPKWDKRGFGLPVSVGWFECWSHGVVRYSDWGFQTGKLQAQKLANKTIVSRTVRSNHIMIWHSP